MPERSTITQVAQIGIETVEGTAVAASKALQSMMIDASPQIATSNFRPQGYKVDTVLAIGTDMTSAKMTGTPTYDEIVYPLSSLLAKVTPTTSGTTGKLWTIAPSATAEDAIASYTVEIGSALRAHKFAGGIFTDFGLKGTRAGLTMDGTMIGQLLTDGITMTASPTALPLVPVLPKDLSFYIDPTFAALGTTKLLRVLDWDFKVGARYGPIWALNAANTSYAAHVETVPKFSLDLLVEADASGMALLAALRSSATQFVRIEAVGPQIGAGPAVNKFTLDVALKLDTTKGFSDHNGLYAFGVTGALVYDAGWAKYLNCAVVNSTAAL